MPPMSVSPGEAVVLICPHCGLPTTASVQGSLLWDGWMPGGREPEDAPEEYRLLQCGACSLPILQARYDFKGEQFGTVYPAPRRLSSAIPEALRRAWQEAETCFGAKAYTACAVMARRVTEGVCKENGVSGSSLMRGMRELQERGIIDKTLAEWSDALRILGNRGAHYDAATVSRQDAEDALAFTEALLDNLYVLKRRFLEMRSRIEAGSERPSPGGVASSLVPDDIDPEDIPP